ncbi:MAG: arginase, partial [Chitinophagaceae bacterium]
MSQWMYIEDFLEPVNTGLLSDDEGYKDGQFGKTIDIFERALPDLTDVDLVIVGCGEQRGKQAGKKPSSGPDAIRRELYAMYFWHPEIRIADIGNIKPGATLSDSYVALKTVLR